MVADYTFGNFLWTMVAFFFWFMAIWIFIMVFSDIFRRNDIGGWAKAGWIFLIFILPFIGVLIYLIARPKMTAQDKEIMEQAEVERQRIEGYSAADEIAKLAKLHEAGTLSDEEFESLKQRALIKVG
jgi:energy-coupling factor transporter transmembrane protein EcfT